MHSYHHLGMLIVCVQANKDGSYQTLYWVGPLQVVCFNDIVHSCVSMQFASMFVVHHFCPHTLVRPYGIAVAKHIKALITRTH